LKWLYTNRNEVTDVGFHTLCKLEVAVKAPVGVATGTLVARLFATYHVAFSEPILPMYTAPTFTYVGVPCAAGATVLGTQTSAKAVGYAFLNSSVTANVVTLRNVAKGMCIHMSAIYQGVATTVLLPTSAWASVSGLTPMTNAPIGAVAPTAVSPQSGLAGTSKMQIESWFVVTRNYPPPTMTFSTTAGDLTPPSASTLGLTFRVVAQGVDSDTTLYSGTLPPSFTSSFPTPAVEVEEIDNDGYSKCMPVLEDHVLVDRLSQEEVELIETMRRARMSDINK
jgi:hypothetical protein